MKSGGIKISFLYIFALYIILSPICQAQNGTQADLRLKVIAIDAGHGGKDPGAVSLDRRTTEKTLTLKIAQKFADKINAAYPEMKVVLTRDRDVFVPLIDRAKIATKANAQLFLSIHINAVGNRSANGFQAYILGQSKKSSSDTYAINREVVARENSVIYLEDDYSTNYQDFDSSSPESQIFMQLMHNAYREQSLKFAELVNDEMVKGPFKKGGVYQDNFAVLRQASMPAVLLEFGFITNSNDLTILRGEKSLNTIVDRLFDAFVKYKEMYDLSVSLEETSETLTETAPKEETESIKDDDSHTILYGSQILASSVKLKESDSRFKGYDVTILKVGNLYKYVVAVSNDKEEAKKLITEVKKSFPDSFFVRIENGATFIEK